MKRDREPLLEITATDPAGIAAQQEVLDAFEAADKSMNDIEIGCMALDAALDAAGAPRISKEQFHKERDQFFAQFERERQLKKSVNAKRCTQFVGVYSEQKFDNKSGCCIGIVCTATNQLEATFRFNIRKNISQYPSQILLNTTSRISITAC